MATSAPSLPKEQWAQVCPKVGGPLEYKKIPVPKPGPDQALVKIQYSGVCHTDLHAMNGDWPIDVKMPLVGGHEGAGTIVAKGELATGFELGDRVGVKWINGTCLNCDFCENSDEPLCADAQLSGYTVDGTFQQYCLAQTAHLTPLPKTVKMDKVAPILCAGITVYKGLKESHARPGQVVAIVGAGGGLGTLAIQYANAMGLRVIGIDGGDEKKAACQQLGCEAFIDYTKTKDLVADVRAASPDGLGPHAVLLVAVSEGPFQQAASYVRSRGSVVAIGLPAHAFLKAPVFDTVARMINIKGSYVGNRRDAKEAVVPLEELPKVFELMRQGKITGRYVLKMPDAE
ncbi:alcohol dehydrogenase I [Uncinocarpus reesii 1704]|uniref:alcohol dehydrogenase n=1 Tax=Uncinocarpus reesii (strain UAMH 1704) TaxID=336963 RepID=C4JNB7_UNCRE|nr:alcohol dehydrogenase I [Uncinocarpus reesii 1704]EEP79477.1 alcohol dehydrogenase I [Uncinocarpus reesii 1704]